MKKTIACVLVFISQLAWASPDPLSVVNQRMKAYNDHNIAAFLNLYSDEIQIFTFPNIPLGQQGKEHLKNIFVPMFKEGKISVIVHQQIVQGNYVINHETVTYDDKPQKYVSIYEVEKGLIKSVQFIRE